MLIYQYDPDIIQITENRNNNEVEFQIKLIKEEPYAQSMKYVRDFFEENTVYTDVLFYFYKNHEYHIIVRQDYYTDFILMLMKHQLLVQVAWSHE